MYIVQEPSSQWCVRKASVTSDGREGRQGNLVSMAYDTEELNPW